eukprot:symbB.v1.2.011495.t1/scaffold772.1/size165093/2
MADVEVQDEKPVLRVLELFAGIGGMRCALKLAELPYQVQIVAAFDVSELCEKAYRHNFGGDEWKKKTIECLKAQDLDALTADLWVMSPPCQPFTRAGKRKDHEDDRSRGLLHLISLLPLMQNPPRAILLENVVGFERSECRQRLLNALSTWEMAEFAIDPEDLGLPNRRPRYYGLFRREFFPVATPVAGKTAGCFWQPVDAEVEEPLLQGCAGHPEDVVPLGNFLQDVAALSLEEEVLGGSIEVPQEIMRTRQQKDQRYDIHQRSDRTSACLTKANGRLPFGHSPLVLQNEEEDKSLEQRPKLSSQGYGAGAATDHLWREGLRVRYLSPAEQLRLMGFPESYSFPSSLKFKDICALVGNSLNCRVVASLLPYLFANSTECPEVEGCRRAAELAARAWGPRESFHSINGEECKGLHFLMPEDWDEALEVCAQAMNGTEDCEGDPMLNFVLGPKMSNPRDPRRLEFLRFLAALILEEDWRWAWGSLALAVLAEDQRLGAVCLARKSQGGVGEGMGWPGLVRHIELTWTQQRDKEVEEEEEKEEEEEEEEKEMQLCERRLRYANQPHFSIPLMMVNPDLQGQGLCSKAMRAVCRAADEEGLPCFLETGGARNVAIYQRFGFRIFEQFMLPDAVTEIFVLHRPSGARTRGFCS